MKAEIYISKMQGNSDGKVVRIDVKAGIKLLSRVEIPIEAFADALMGMGAVPVEYIEKS